MNFYQIISKRENPFSESVTLMVNSNTNMLAKPGTMAVGLAVIGFDNGDHGGPVYTLLEAVFNGMIWDARSVWSTDSIDEEFFRYDINEFHIVQLLRPCADPLYF